MQQKPLYGTSSLILTGRYYISDDVLTITKISRERTLNSPVLQKKEQSVFANISMEALYSFYTISNSSGSVKRFAIFLFSSYPSRTASLVLDG